jgi:hypothetical protein
VEETNRRESIIEEEEISGINEYEGKQGVGTRF